MKRKKISKYWSKGISPTQYIRFKFNGKKIVEAKKLCYKRFNKYILQYNTSNGWIPIHYESDLSRLEQWRRKRGYKVRQTRIIDTEEKRRIR